MAFVEATIELYLNETLMHEDDYKVKSGDSLDITCKGNSPLMLQFPDVEDPVRKNEKNFSLFLFIIEFTLKALRG